MMTLLLWLHACIYTVALWVSKIFLVIVYGFVAFALVVVCLCVFMLACDVAFDMAQDWKKKRK